MTGPRLIRTDRAGDAAIPPAMRRVRGRAAGYLLARHALSPDEAVAYIPPGAFDRWWLERQLRDEVVRRGAADGLWIDLATHAHLAERRSGRAVIIVGPLALAAAALAMWFY